MRTGLAASIETPGKTAPDVSLTTPAKVPLPTSCAEAAPALDSNRLTIAARRVTRRPLIANPPSNETRTITFRLRRRISEQTMGSNRSREPAGEYRGSLLQDPSMCQRSSSAPRRARKTEAGARGLRQSLNQAGGAVRERAYARIAVPLKVPSDIAHATPASPPPTVTSARDYSRWRSHVRVPSTNTTLAFTAPWGRDRTECLGESRMAGTGKSPPCRHLVAGSTGLEPAASGVTGRAFPVFRSARAMV